jgi:uncharacterized protein DUF4105
VPILKVLFKGVAILLLMIVVAASAAWGTLAVHYSQLGSSPLGTVLAAAFALVSLAVLVALFLRRWRWRALGAFAVLFAGLIAWWSGIAPSNDRHWKQEVATLPEVKIDGDQVTIRNIRNFHYRTETDFTAAYYDKTFDLGKLASVDLIAVYWGSPAIAHMMVSFDFGAGDQLAISIERRDEIGESYSTIKGLFKQYELFYVVADERDVVRLRTNVRRDPPEDVYVYRVKGSIEDGRRLFLEYMKKIETLATRPEFYNTLTTNCTGNIWLHSRVNPGSVPYSWKILLSGYVPEYLYELGKLDTRVPFPELQRRSHVNAAARGADQSEDFSRRIRAGLPE